MFRVNPEKQIINIRSELVNKTSKYKKVMQKKLFIILLLFVNIVAYPQRKPEITAQELKTDVYFLASDSLKGRKPGTKEANVAANYIRDQFKASGLKLIGDNGFQYFEIVTDITTGANNSLAFEGFKGTLKKDFLPHPFERRKHRRAAWRSRA